MERRNLFTFVFLSFTIYMTFQMIRNADEEPVDAPDPNQVVEQGEKDPKAADEIGPEDNNADAKPDEEPRNDDEEVVAKLVDRKFLTLGSIDPTESNPYRMGVVVDTKGASIRSIELSDQKRFTSTEHRELGGYLGKLALEDVTTGGCKVQVVLPGTPAFKATSPQSTETGLQPGDIITTLDNVMVNDREHFQSIIDDSTKPNQSVTIIVDRVIDRKAAPTKITSLTFTCTLGKHPLAVISQSITTVEDEKTGVKKDVVNPAAFLTTLSSVVSKSISKSIHVGEKEIPNLPSLFERNWEWKEISENEVHFETTLTPSELKKIGIDGHLKLVKKYQIKPVPLDKRDDPSYPGYDLNYTIEIHNESPDPIKVGYRQQGPTGLPLEGWWFANKIARDWGGAGIRDVVWESTKGNYSMFTVSALLDRLEDEDKDAQTPLYGGLKDTTTKYVGVDAQYFNCSLLVNKQLAEGDALAKNPINFYNATAEPFGPEDSLKKTRTDCSFTLDTLPDEIPGIDPDDPTANILTHEYQIFAGPKDPALLASYGMEKLEYYGWFSYVSVALLWVLHLLYSVIGNYGIAIILLTVMVRGAMTPMSRKQAKNMLLQQALAPELKKIREMYKDEMEKQHAAQQALFKKHNFNPIGGCGVMFLQLPIFLGLYRALAVDIHLRQAPLIPGIDWCSNLAAPDQLWYWQAHLPAYLAGGTGWLGPYLNILPLFTIVLFLIQQKLFTPPATDENMKMQQQVMTFMMFFIGIMFFKVPAGLCLYFITSSLWGIVERKLLPKPKLNIKIDPSDSVPVTPRKPKAKPQKKKKK
ncbi:MAG: membrane protein insertase YidC [Pirellulales bacterium]